jgi:two-component system cell cycle sensor histidine kinase/response regulator CckA
MPQEGAIEIRGENTFEPADRWENALHIRTGHYVRVSIADTGIGISREHLCRVWDPYFSTKAGGRGLGLATTYAILKDHGGYVSVESPPGRGTIVRLNFPALPIRSRQDLTPVRAAGDKRRVLIMDDEASTRVLAINMLQFLGYDTDAVDDGSVALDLFKSALQASAPFDVVILGLMVPGKLGGKEAIAQFAAADPAVKAILISGYTRDPAMTEFRKYGFSAVLTKPFSLQELAVTMDFVIGAPACRVH